MKHSGNISFRKCTSQAESFHFKSLSRISIHSECCFHFIFFFFFCKNLFSYSPFILATTSKQAIIHSQDSYLKSFLHNAHYHLLAAVSSRMLACVFRFTEKAMMSCIYLPQKSFERQPSEGFLYKKNLQMKSDGFQSIKRKT